MMQTAETFEVKNAETPEKTREIIYNELRRDLAHWMEAKEDLVWRPAIELTEERGEFTARALVPGVNSEGVQVLVTPEWLMISGVANPGKSNERKILRSIEFPRPVDPDRVDAEITDGMLFVRAKIVGVQKVAIFRPRAA